MFPKLFKLRKSEARDQRLSALYTELDRCCAAKHYTNISESTLNTEYTFKPKYNHRFYTFQVSNKTIHQNSFVTSWLSSGNNITGFRVRKQAGIHSSYDATSWMLLCWLPWRHSSTRKQHLKLLNKTIKLGLEKCHHLWLKYLLSTVALMEPTITLHTQLLSRPLEVAFFCNWFIGS